MARIHGQLTGQFGYAEEYGTSATCRLLKIKSDERFLSSCESFLSFESSFGNFFRAAEAPK
jgi:hypothetical protein